MIIQSVISRLNLRAGELLRLPKAAGATIALNSGSVWITRDNDPRDVVLAPGERLDFTETSNVLIQAFETSSVAIGPTDCAAMIDGGQRAHDAAAATGVARRATVVELGGRSGRRDSRCTDWPHAA